MIQRLILFVFLALSACTGVANEDGAAGVSSLKVDLAAVASTGKVVPVDGITSAGQPDADQFKVFADNGYAAVIDLRTPGESRGLDEPAVVEGLGMDYLTLPVGSDDITMEKARELGELIDRFDGPVLVHCASANRVGALLALRTYDETGDAEMSLETGRAGGLKSLEGAVREAMGVD
jgi:uncharacterized protein (TIGR01244 family)